MDTYEYPLGVQFKASTPEHAAAHAFGGKPTDYLATVQEARYPMVVAWKNLYPKWVEVTSADGSEFIGDIPVVSE